jgi:hypothetical protein
MPRVAVTSVRAGRIAAQLLVAHELVRAQKVTHGQVIAQVVGS